MPGLVIHISNQLEKLSGQLAGILADGSGEPLVSDIIVVHSKGMGQWLAMELADYNGIFANARFPFPNAFLEMLFHEVEPDARAVSLFDVDVMTFRIMKILPTCLKKDSFEPLEQYLSDQDPFKCYQLSEKLAELFDQYLIFRPDMITQWEKGEGRHWQAQLWREISAGTGELHRAARKKILLEKIRNHPEALAGIPERLFLFGISFLPIFHLEVMAALSAIRTVHLFVMNPCCEYWGDIVSDREKRRLRRRTGKAYPTDESLFLETGNALLSSMGAMGKDFFNLLQGMEGHINELYEDIEEKHLLSAVQADILYLRERAASPIAVAASTGEDPASGQKRRPVDDRSIQIHSCHGVLREVEVLHDHLLAMFDEDRSLLPGDILVTAPDIQSYAPFVHAVFGGQTDEHLKIPYHISDRSLLADNPVVDGLIKLLDLAGSRFTVPEILSILDIDGVKEKFNLSRADVPIIEKWIADTNIRWGIDATHRAVLGLPEVGENTWKSGFQRMLLGVAMPGRNRQFFSGVLPYDDIEGADVQILGNFLHLFDQMVKTVEILRPEKTLGQWTNTLVDIMDRFFPEKEAIETDRQNLRRIFQTLTEYEEAGGIDFNFGLPVIKALIRKQLETANSSAGFISGNVTFCTMLPFRSVPAKVVCLLGMNGDAFPRDFFHPGFDLMAKNPRPGDRIRRNDDKYLFLQALVSAREKLYISYVGQSNRDNTRIPPSVLVSELIDYLKTFGLSEDRIIICERLQGFSDAYFTGDGSLFSFSAEDFSACMAADDQSSRKDDAGFISTPLSAPEIGFKSLDVHRFGFFFNNPSRYLLENRLGVFLAEEAPIFEEEENFFLRGLNRYQVGQDLVQGDMENADPEFLGMVEQAMGRLPHGAPGSVVLCEAGAEARQFAQKVRRYANGDQAGRVILDRTFGDFLLTGELRPIYENIHLQPFYSSFKPKYLLRAWICHLALNAADPAGFPGTTILVCRDETWRMDPVKNGAEILQTLLDAYWQGLSRTMIFFPETSFAYADAIFSGKKNERAAITAAMAKWKGNDFSPGESSDPYFELCFPDGCVEAEIRNQSFQKTALELFLPLLNGCTRVKD